MWTDGVWHSRPIAVALLPTPTAAIPLLCRDSLQQPVALTIPDQL
jgi:hypothetical protein